MKTRPAPAAFEDWVHDEYDDAAIADVCDLPATTLAGVRAKAVAVHAFYDPDPPEGGCSEMAPALWELICELAGKTA